MKPVLRSVTILLCITVAAASALAGTIRHDVSDQLYLDEGAKYGSVGQVYTGSHYGSGILIHPNWAVTAAHVVENVSSVSFELNGTDYAAESWVVHPNWDSANLLNGYDIGLIGFGNNDIAAISGINPAQRYTDTKEIGQNGVLAGFGATGDGQTGYTSFSGDSQPRRAGWNVIDTAYKNRGKNGDRILLVDFDNPAGATGDDGNNYGSAEPLDLEFLIAPGDSGGGLFLDSNADGTGDLLAGIHSFLWGRLDNQSDADYDDVAGITRLTYFNEWIDSVIGTTSDGGGTDDGTDDGGGGGPPSWAGGPGGKSTSVVVPEPATLSLLAVSGLALLRRRRR